MENRQELDISKERNFFLSQVKKSPRFLWQHLQALSSVILDQYKSKYFTKVRGKHLSTKQPLPWLTEVKGANRSLCQTTAELLQRIPQFKLTDIPPKKIAATTVFTQTQFPDNEDYLAKHRWGVLLETLLNATTETSQTLPELVIRHLEFSFSKTDPALETYSTCERVANLLFWTACQPYAARQKLPESMLTFLQTSLQWILTHLEFYGAKTGNHILNNARALILAGTVLNNAAAVETGVLILEKMLPELIQANGFLRERSSHYQLIILGWLLDARAFLLATEFYPPAKLNFLETIIINMRYAAALICDQQGYLQGLIGDVSPDITPSKTAQRLLRFYPAEWPVPLTVDDNTVLVRDDWATMVAGNNKVILNCPAGNYPKTFASHAHNDITSFIWLHNNEQILIDCGRARYTKDPVSSRQKSALGHSLPFVNGFAPLSESLVINGNWWPTPYANAHVTLKALSNHEIAIIHNGFKRATPVNIHERKISLANNGLTVNDQFRGQGEVQIELRWQLHPSFMLLDHSNFCVRNGDIELTIDLSAMHTAPQIDFVPADAKRSRYSSEYGHAIGNPFILMKWKIKLPFTCQVTFRVKSCVG